MLHLGPAVPSSGVSHHDDLCFRDFSFVSARMRTRNTQSSKGSCCVSMVVQHRAKQQMDRGDKTCSILTNPTMLIIDPHPTF